MVALTGRTRPLRTAVGLLAAAVSAPLLVGLTLLIWTIGDLVMHPVPYSVAPPAAPEEHSGEVGQLFGQLVSVAFLLLFFGLPISLAVTAAVGLPGIVLARYLGVSSAAAFGVGGFVLGIVALVAFTLKTGEAWTTLLAPDPKTLWAVIGFPFVGMTSALVYWAVAERGQPGRESNPPEAGGDSPAP